MTINLGRLSLHWCPLPYGPDFPWYQHLYIGMHLFYFGRLCITWRN